MIWLKVVTWFKSMIWLAMFYKFLVNNQVVNEHHEPWLTWLIALICLVFGSTTLVKNVISRLLLFWSKKYWEWTIVVHTFAATCNDDCWFISLFLSLHWLVIVSLPTQIMTKKHGCLQLFGESSIAFCGFFPQQWGDSQLRRGVINNLGVDSFWFLMDILVASHKQKY